MKFTPLLSRLALMSALALSVPVVAQNAKITAEQKADVIRAMSNILNRQAFVAGADFAKWDEYLEGARDRIDAAEDVNAFTLGINQALRNFGFSHIALLSPEAAQRRQTASVTGIGISVRREDEGFRIMRTFDNAPAKEAGLLPGDLIIKADGVKVEQQTQISGEEGTNVVVTVRRKDGSEKDFTITRRKYSIKIPETIVWVDNETARVEIPSFEPSNYSATNVDAIMTEAMKAKNIIVDLRQNSGGLVLNMEHLLSYFLAPTTPYGTFLTRNMANRYVDEAGGSMQDLAGMAKYINAPSRITNDSRPRFNGEIVVLVSGGSASAAEIVASALKEHRRATVIGSKTAGAVIASVFAAMPHGFHLQVPIREFVTDQGRRLEGDGVDVDITASLPDYPDDPDEGITKAQAVFRLAAYLNNAAKSGG